MSFTLTITAMGICRVVTGMLGGLLTLGALASAISADYEDSSEGARMRVLALVLGVVGIPLIFAAYLA